MSYPLQARILFLLGFHRAAILMLRIDIEKHIHHLSDRNEIRGRFHQRLRSLRTSGVLSKSEWNQVRLTFHECSKAVHGGPLPSLSSRFRLIGVADSLRSTGGEV